MLLRFAPQQLLSLLPPPPAEAGWPSSFALQARAAPPCPWARARRDAPTEGAPPGGSQRVAAELQRQAYRRRAASYLDYPLSEPEVGGGLLEEEASAEPYQKLPPTFPPRRRAQRLSYAVWTVIGDEGLLSRRFKWGVAHLQPLLEAEGTSDRLRLALLRMRELAGRSGA